MISEIASKWKDEEQSHIEMNESFRELAMKDEQLHDHRIWVEQNGMGMGERSFHWLWKLLVDEMPHDFTFLEIGVFCGQVLSLIRLLADRSNKLATIYGISPMDERGGEQPADYYHYVEMLHDATGVRKGYKIIRGMSQDEEVLRKVDGVKIDLLFIDGGHKYEDVVSDINNFLPLVKIGGYVVFDDACNGMHMPNNYFHGIESTTNAVNDLMPMRKDFKFLFNVMHNRVYKKI